MDKGGGGAAAAAGRGTSHVPLQTCNVEETDCAGVPESSMTQEVSVIVAVLGPATGVTLIQDEILMCAGLSQALRENSSRVIR